MIYDLIRCRCKKATKQTPRDTRHVCIRHRRPIPHRTCKETREVWGGKSKGLTTGQLARPWDKKALHGIDSIVPKRMRRAVANSNNVRALTMLPAYGSSPDYKNIIQADDGTKARCFASPLFQGAGGGGRRETHF